MSDVGGQPFGHATIVLDEADGKPPDSEQLTSGSFKPTNFSAAADPFPAPAPAPSGVSNLSGFDGMGPSGALSLYAVDDSAGGIGEIAVGWSLRIKAKAATGGGLTT